MKQHDHHLEQFIQWIQSPQVQVAVGDDETERIYRLPNELLRQRSTVLAKLILDNGEQDVVRCNIPLTTSVATLNAFIAWITAARPQLGEQDALEDTVELGILADQLGVWALSNQIVDLIEAQVMSSAWKWSSQALNGIYEKVASGQPLRRLVQATILVMDVDHSIYMSEEDKLEEMAMDHVFMAHAALGCDYYRAKREQGTRKSKWTRTGFKKSCEYHEHPWAGAREADEIEMDEGACPYMTDDCYPVWKVQDVDHVDFRDDIEAVTISKEEDCVPWTRDEPEAEPEAEPEPYFDVDTGPQEDLTVDDDAAAPIAESEMMTVSNIAVIEEDERPLMTARAIQAEIERMSLKDRKKLKKWM